MTMLQAGLLSASVIALSMTSDAAASGEATRIAEVRLVGARAAAAVDGADEIVASLATRPGASLSEDAIAADISRLWRLGRFTDIRVERSGDGRVIVFRVAQHPLAAQLEAVGDALIEAIEIRGNEKTRDSVIRRELTIAPGDRAERVALVASAERLRRLGFFDGLDIGVRSGSTPALAVVTFTVRERATGSFEIGGSYGEISGVGATASVVQSNLFGTGHELDLAARLAAREQQFQLRYTNPRIGDSWWRGTARAYDSRRQLLGFERAATGASVSLGRPIAKGTRATLTYRLESTRASRELASTALRRGNDAYLTDLFRSGRTSSVRADLVHGRGQAPDPAGPARADGPSVGGYAEIASAWTGSENRFRRVGVWASFPVAITSGVGLVARSSVDLITSPDARGVALSERLQAGGIHSVRGYGYGELGPQLSLGGPDGPEELSSLSYGGNLRLLASVELHVPLIAAVGLSGVLFADAGNVFDLEGRSCRRSECASAVAILTGLRASVGFGLRWASPIGNLRFEWGVPLARRPGDPRIRFHFGASPLI